MQKTKGTVDLIVIVKSDQSFAKTTNDKPLSDNSYISINEYLGVGYIKSYLMDRDIPVNIHVLTNDQRELLDQVADSAPFIVGFTLYADTATEVLSSIRYLSQRSPNTYIVVGGPQTYEIAESLLRDNLEISSVIFGEGEETFYELYNRLSTSQTLKDCAGTAYRQDNGTVILNPFRTPIANLDSLSFPARDIYEKNHQEFLYITGARGCLGRCSFLW